jgi:hypothetical protein
LIDPSRQNYGAGCFLCIFLKDIKLFWKGEKPWYSAVFPKVRSAWLSILVRKKKKNLRFLPKKVSFYASKLLFMVRRITFNEFVVRQNLFQQVKKVWETLVYWLRLKSHNQEIVGLNPNTVYWMDVSNATALTLSIVPWNNKNKGSQMGLPKTKQKDFESN